MSNNRDPNNVSQSPKRLASPNKSTSKKLEISFLERNRQFLENKQKREIEHIEASKRKEEAEWLNRQEEDRSKSKRLLDMSNEKVEDRLIRYMKSYDNNRRMMIDAKKEMEDSESMPKLKYRKKSSRYLRNEI